MAKKPAIDYTAGILDAYEDEVAGAAYFRGLVAFFPEKRDFLLRCCVLEEQTAARLVPLVRKYRLKHQAAPFLSRRGESDARAAGHKAWQTLVRESVDGYPLYVAQFRQLESLAPAEDRDIVASLTGHEVQLIEWLQAELGHG